MPGLVRFILCSGILVASTTAQAGIDQESNTDGFDPAAESFRINEARRLNAISRQLELKRRMLWEYGFDPASPPVDQPIGHESQQVGPNRWIYRPIYPGQEVMPEQELPEPDAADGPELLPLPMDNGAVAPPTRVPRALPKPADAEPGDRIPPLPNPPNKRRGPREL